MTKLFKSFLVLLALSFNSPVFAQITVTDLLDRKVTIDGPGKRVLLGFNFEDFLAIVGPNAMDRVIGVSLTPWRDWRPMQYQTYLKAMPSIADLPDVGDTESGTFSVEKVIAAQPDLVILAAWQYKALGEGA
ncbi:MAG: iron ABC transporter substrate-binding protein, partial [Alphaproteobacteria bacterium]|nr:iron ABC transporter substrate-binding protein [Alphaproteobacteria bacterium]